MYFMEEFCVPKGAGRNGGKWGRGLSRHKPSPGCKFSITLSLALAILSSILLLSISFPLPRRVARGFNSPSPRFPWSLLGSSGLNIVAMSIICQKTTKKSCIFGTLPPFLSILCGMIHPHILVSLSSRSFLLSYFSPLTMLIIVHTYYPFITLVEILVTEVICLGIAGSVCTLFHLKNSAHLLTIHQFPI